MTFSHRLRQTLAMLLIVSLLTQNLAFAQTTSRTDDGGKDRVDIQNTFTADDSSSQINISDGDDVDRSDQIKPGSDDEDRNNIENANEIESTGIFDFRPRQLTPLEMLFRSLTGGGADPGVPPPDSEAPETPDPVGADLMNSLKGAKGNSDIDLFSGSLGFSYDLWIPNGRLGITPTMNLTYGSNARQFDSFAGYGWNLTESAIFRSTEEGTDQLYEKNHFTAIIEGQSTELVLIDAANGIYGAKIDSGFTKYQFDGQQWVVTDTSGNKFYFGISGGSRQVDPDNPDRVYKWALEKFQDPNGNFVSYTYFHDAGQIYPETIRYTGFDQDPGIYEVRFVRENRSGYSNYNRGFEARTNFILDDVEVYLMEHGNEELIVRYDLEHEAKNNAVLLLTSITTVGNNGDTRPPTTFEYFSRTNMDEGSAINLLSEVGYPGGGKNTFTYQPSTAYKYDEGSLRNSIPIIMKTVATMGTQAAPNEPIHTTSYEYQDGHYYFDHMDAYKKEYSGFHQVTTIDPVGNVSKSYFHQSEFSLDGSDRGEFDDHIAKKGKPYRQEQYDDSGNLYQLSITKWQHDVLPDEDVRKDRFFVYQDQSVSVDYDGNATRRARAESRMHDAFGNVIQMTNFGEVVMLDDAGNFTDELEDKKITDIQYAVNGTKYMYSYPASYETHDFHNHLIAGTQLFYDKKGAGKIEFGNETKRKTLLKAPSKYLITQKKYEDHGQIIELIDARKQKTQIEYDQYALHPVKVINPLRQESTRTYNLTFGTIQTSTDPNGSTTRYTYDPFGRTVEVWHTNPADVTQELQKALYAYHEDNYPFSTEERLFTHNLTTDGDDIFVEKLTYIDGLRREIQTRTKAEQQGQYVITNTTYDERGNKKDVFLPSLSQGRAFTPIDLNWIKNTTTYDALGRPSEVINILGTSRFEYDDWKKTIIDANGNHKDTYTDAAGNLIKVTEYLDHQTYDTHYTYNALNNLVGIEDAMGNVKTYKYDLLGRRLSEEAFHKPGDTTFGTWEYQYDQNGNLTQRIDAKGQKTKWKYDKLDRPMFEDFKGSKGKEIVYTYDQGDYGIGKLSEVTSPGAKEVFSYDILGRIISHERKIDGKSFETKYDFDFIGRPLTVTFPDGGTEVFTYDHAGLLESVANGNDSVMDSITYAPTGSVERLSYANGTQTLNTFDPQQLYRLTQRQTTNPQREQLQDLNYVFDAVSNILEIKDKSDTQAAKNTTYQYDDLYRLTRVDVTRSANNADYFREYTYDIIANMLSRSDAKGQYIYAGNTAGMSAQNTLATPHAVTQIGSTNFEYDANGNLITDGLWTHEWNWKDQITKSINNDTGDEIEYRYDHEGNRTWKKSGKNRNTKKTFYVGRHYDEEDGNAKKYFHAGDTKIATVSDNGTKYHHEDHLTGSNVDTDPQGELAQLQDYFPYGDVRIDENISGEDSDYKFTGKEKDDETGLYYYGARYYNSGISRFVSRDTWEGNLDDPQSLNRYAYTRNNPVIYKDDSGNFFHIVVGAVTGAAAGVVGQAISDIFEGKFSGRNAYIGAATAGAIGGGIIAATGGLGLVSGAIVNAGAELAGNIVEQSLNMHTGKVEDRQKNFNIAEAAATFASGAITSFAPGTKISNFKISAGRGNFLSIDKQIRTKTEKGLIKNKSWKTQAKRGFGTVAEGIASDVAEGSGAGTGKRLGTMYSQEYKPLIESQKDDDKDSDSESDSDGE